MRSTQHCCLTSWTNSQTRVQVCLVLCWTNVTSWDTGHSDRLFGPLGCRGSEGSGLCRIGWAPGGFRFYEDIYIYSETHFVSFLKDFCHTKPLFLVLSPWQPKSLMAPTCWHYPQLIYIIFVQVSAHIAAAHTTQVYSLIPRKFFHYYWMWKESKNEGSLLEYWAFFRNGTSGSSSCLSGSSQSRCPFWPSFCCFPGTFKYGQKQDASASSPSVSDFCRCH